MADEVNEKQVYDAHTKEIDLVNRDPKHLNDDVVKVSLGGCLSPTTLLSRVTVHPFVASSHRHCFLDLTVGEPLRSVVRNPG